MKQRIHSKDIHKRMDGRDGTVIFALLLCIIAGAPAAGQVLDVCASCHVNATCDDKVDNSGKVCNCKYGFVGNGRTFCQDKDECQIGASRICGSHSSCHNTYGSYYCTCKDGYSPSNNMGNFIPNDGTHCQDIDECQIEGLCGEGGRCRNLDGTFECSCLLGYRAHDGVEPFHPHTDKTYCKVVDCGPPVPPEDTVLLSVSETTYGGVATFTCDEGFVWRRGNNASLCGRDELWRGTTMVCEAKCGPVPVLANSELVWHNRSVAIYRCVEGYHSWRGSNASLCSSSGVWHKATLRCIEIKPPINHLFVSNEKCLQWIAEKFEEDTEAYKVIYAGSRDYDSTFLDKGKRRLTSRAEQVEVCLRLLPATNYSISITAVSARFTVTITTNTSLTAPPAPIVYYREFDTPIPTLRLQRSPDTLDAISLYQVFVLHAEGVVLFDCASTENQNPFGQSLPSTEYIAAQMSVKHVKREINFTVGDGGHHGGFYNAPLENGQSYYIILRAASQWKRDFKSSCVLWAKVKGTSYVLWVSSVSAAVLVSVLAFVALGGYTYVWYVWSCFQVGVIGVTCLCCSSVSLPRSFSGFSKRHMTLFSADV